MSPPCHGGDCRFESGRYCMDTQVIKLAAKALVVGKEVRYGNWMFEWDLINELYNITQESDYPVGMEEVESVLIALTKLNE